MTTAYRTTVGAKTANFTLTEMTRSASTSGSSASATVTGSGAVDFSTGSFELHINAPSGGSEQVLETDGIAYIQVPPTARSQVSGNKPWASVNLDQVDEAKVGRTFAQLASVNSDSPTQLLAHLQAVSDNVTILGTDTVGGVSTAHYQATVDLNKEAGLVRTKSGAKAATLVTQEERALGTHTIPVDVWVDAKHLVRQFQTQVPVPPASSGAPAGSGTATVTMSFSSFGVPVSVGPPPTSEVTDITSEVIQSAGNGAAA